MMSYLRGVDSVSSSVSSMTPPSPVSSQLSSRIKIHSSQQQQHGAEPHSIHMAHNLTLSQKLQRMLKLPHLAPLVCWCVLGIILVAWGVI